MYYPYFRGKQYELIAIRESAELLSKSNFIPIIEPVREQFSGLQKSLRAIYDNDGKAILISNPEIGDLKNNHSLLKEFIVSEQENHPENISVGILLKDNASTDDILLKCNEFKYQDIALIHYGFTEAKALGKAISEKENIKTSIFLQNYCGKLYQKHFRVHENRVLVRDGFLKRKRNSDHPDFPEFFSDLHATYEDEGVNGFGDFSIVGDEYSESGGPAYTVAIHLTFIDYAGDEEMLIQHFKSDRQDTPRDPAGKFAEALTKLIDTLTDHKQRFFRSSAIEEFIQLHNNSHYPGLGYVKKLSIKHHIETLSEYFKEK